MSTDYATDLMGNAIYPGDVVAVALSKGHTAHLVLVTVTEVVAVPSRVGMPLNYAIKGIPSIEGSPSAHIYRRDPKTLRYEGTNRMVLVERRSALDDGVRVKAIEELFAIMSAP